MKPLLTIFISIFLIFGWFANVQAVDNPIPIIDSISPTSALPNASVTVTGRNFIETSGGNLAIFYQGTEVKGAANMAIIRATTQSNPTQELSFRVPNIASGPYTVKVNSTIGLQTRESDGVLFTVLAASVPVNQHPPSLRIEPTSASIVQPQTKTFRAIYRYWSQNNYTEQDATGGAVWTSSNQSVAQVVQGTAVCGGNDQNITIRASYLGLTASASLQCSGFAATTTPTPAPTPTLSPTPTLTTSVCSDTDADADGSTRVRTKGTCTQDGGIIGEDYCDGLITLKEWNCSFGGTCELNTFDCKMAMGSNTAVCQNGKCVIPTTPSPTLASSPTPVPAPSYGTGSGITILNPIGVNTFEELLNILINFIFWMGIVIAPIIFIIAGFFYITALGNTQRLETAKKMIWYTIIGLVVLLLAKGIVAVLKSILGAA